ncbi:MAG: cysteine hydrolase [Thiotrichales bacterium]|nr:cysteine hydrolase [Thiotrichales bacterium]
MATRGKREFLVGQPVLVVVDIQGGDGSREGPSPIPHMADADERLLPAADLIQKARDCDVPVVFIQEAHRPDHVDFGRELDGAEDVHLIEGDPWTEISTSIGKRPDDYFIRKRRYSCFFGTDFEILMKGLGAETLIFIGGLTDVCVHYSFVDGHQNNYYCRVVEDCVAGSSLEAHDASLRAMEYLQAGARCKVADVKRVFEQYAANRQPLAKEV